MIAPGQRFLHPGAGCKDKAKKGRKKEEEEEKKTRYARALAPLGRNINGHATIGDENERTVQRRVRLFGRTKCGWHIHDPVSLALRPGHSRTSQTRLRGCGEAGTGGFFEGVYQVDTCICLMYIFLEVYCLSVQVASLAPLQSRATSTPSFIAYGNGGCPSDGPALQGRLLCVLGR